MKKLILVIGSPEKYISKSVDENGKRKQRVAYQVTGTKEAIDAYNADMTARTGKVSVDEKTGNPLFTVSLSAFTKGGMNGTIERSSKADDGGQFNWYIDTNEARDLDEAVAGADEFTKQAHAMSKYDELKANIKALAANKRAIASVQPADLSK